MAAWRALVSFGYLSWNKGRPANPTYNCLPVRPMEYVQRKSAKNPCLGENPRTNKKTHIDRESQAYLMLISNWFTTLHSWLISCQVVGSIVIGFELITVCHKFYVTETHIMYFIRRCWFLKCSEEIHYVPLGAGDMWYYVTVDDGWEEVLGCNVYITSQYISPNAKYWTALSGNRTRAPQIECGRSNIELWNLYIIWVC